MNRRQQVVFALVLVLLGGALFFKIQSADKDTFTTMREEVKRGDIQVTILSTGTVQPQNRLEIKPPIAGRVDRIMVNEGDVVKKGQVLAWMSSTERAAMIDAARSQGHEELKKWEEIYKQTPIVAPLSGMVISKKVEAGQTFTTSEPVLVMSDRLTIKAQVDETDLGKIKVDQDCDIRLDAYPEQPIAGKVVHIAYEAKTVSNVTTYIIDVLPMTSVENMRSGMTANVTFFVQKKSGVLLVPTGFIKYEKGKPNLLIERGNVPPSLLSVSLGTSDGKMTEIKDGVNEGDFVILQIPNSKDNQGRSPFFPTRNRSGGGNNQRSAPSPMGR